MIGESKTGKHQSDLVYDIVLEHVDSFAALFTSLSNLLSEICRRKNQFPELNQHMLTFLHLI
jgi:hypothetical protein